MRWLHFETWKKIIKLILHYLPHDENIFDVFVSYNFTLFSSFNAILVIVIGVVEADGVDTAVVFNFLFRLPGPLLLILSEPGLLGGDSLTMAGPIVFIWPIPTPLKCPPADVGPCIIDDTGATVIAGGGVWWLFLPPLLDVVITVPLGTAVTTDEAVVCDCCNDGWVLEPRFGLRTFSCLSDDWDLEKCFKLFHCNDA